MMSGIGRSLKYSFSAPVIMLISSYMFTEISAFSPSLKDVKKKSTSNYLDAQHCFNNTFCVTVFRDHQCVGFFNIKFSVPIYTSDQFSVKSQICFSEFSFLKLLSFPGLIKRRGGGE